MTYNVEQLRRTEFPWAHRGDAVYLNNASTGPLPERSLRALADFNKLRAEPFRLSDSIQFDTLARGRELVARLINARPEEIALATNTGAGLNLAAGALPLSAGDVVLTPDLEFPANVYPWMQLAERRGVIYRRVKCPDGVLDEAVLTRALEDPAVRVLSMSWVGFATGYAADLQSIGRMCRERGVYFVVDGIQGLGALTLDVSACNIDILACGAQKWLLSPWGTGFTYIRRELIQQLEPNVLSWMSVRGSDDFSRLVDYDFTWREDARRFELVTLPFQDFAGMNASLELIMELGTEAVATHVASLADQIIAWGAEHTDVDVITPGDRTHRAGIVSVRPPDAAAASARLRAAGVSHSMREGAVRLSPHLYNNAQDVQVALAAILPT